MDREDVMTDITSTKKLNKQLQSKLTDLEHDNINLKMSLQIARLQQVLYEHLFCNHLAAKHVTYFGSNEHIDMTLYHPRVVSNIFTYSYSDYFDHDYFW